MTTGRTLTGLILCLAALTMLMACMEAGPSSPSPVTEAPPPPLIL